MDPSARVDGYGKGSGQILRSRTKATRTGLQEGSRTSVTGGREWQRLREVALAGASIARTWRIPASEECVPSGA